MSATRSVTEANIRLLIDDSNPDDYAISSVRLHQVVQGEMQLIGSRMALPMEAVTSVSLVAGTYDYTLTGIVADVRQVMLDSNGRALDPLTLEEMNRNYYQDTTPGTGRGTPRYYALYETSAQLSRMRVAPTPNASDTLKLYHGLIPAALSADSSTIPFSAPLLRVLERSAAAECVAMMSPEDRAKRMIGIESLTLWREMAEQGFRDENWRLRILGSGTQDRVIEVEI